MNAFLVAMFGFAFAVGAAAMAEDQTRFPSEPLIQPAHEQAVTIPEMVITGFECEPFVKRYVARFPELDFTEELAYCHQSDVSSHSTEAQAIADAKTCSGSASWTVKDLGRWLAFCDMGE